MLLTAPKGAVNNLKTFKKKKKRNSIIFINFAAALAQNIYQIK